MESENREGFIVVGYPIRTTNAAEGNQSTALIPSLWQRVMAPSAFDRVTARSDAALYAVYTDYETDHNGAYTHVVGVRVTDANDLPEGMVTVRVPSAQYSVRKIDGPIPDALIKEWMSVWAETSENRLHRSFTTDVEVHGPDGTELWIATAE